MSVEPVVPARVDAAVVRPANTLLGVRHGLYKLASHEGHLQNAQHASRPARVRLRGAVVPPELGPEVVRSKTDEYLDAPDVRASYFLFDARVEYCLDFSSLGMVVDAVSTARETLRRHGYWSHSGQPQYGPIEQRLRIRPAAPGRYRTATLERGTPGEFPSEGCWSGDFCPRYSYDVHVFESGVSVIPHRGSGALSAAELAALPGPKLGEPLGRVHVGLPSEAEAGLKLRLAPRTVRRVPLRPISYVSF